LIFRRSDVWSIQLEFFKPDSYNYLLPSRLGSIIDTETILANNIKMFNLGGTNYTVIVTKTHLLVNENAQGFKLVSLRIEETENDETNQQFEIISSSWNVEHHTMYLHLESKSKSFLLSYDLNARKLTNLNSKLIPGLHQIYKLSDQYVLVSDVDMKMTLIRLRTWEVIKIDPSKGMIQVIHDGNSVINFTDEPRAKQGRVTSIAVLYIRNFVGTKAESIFISHKTVASHYTKVTQDGKKILVHSKDMTFLYDTTTLKKQMLHDYEEKQTLHENMGEFSPDSRFLAVLSICAGTAYVFSCESGGTHIQIPTTAIMQRTGYQHPQYFSYDKNSKYFMCLRIDPVSKIQSLDVYSLMNFQPVCNIEVPKHLTVLTHHILETFIKIVGVHESSAEHPGCFELLEYTFPFGADFAQGWAGTRRALFEILRPRQNQYESDLAQERLMNLWKTIPKTVINKGCPVPLLMALMDNSTILQQFLSICLDFKSLLYHHELLQVLFLNSSTEWIKMATLAFQNYLKQEELKTNIQDTFRVS
jgi:hypothetical protein